ncbi:MAG: hypothetical protein O4803_09845, partial [Trichodesmium sp. St15_bin1_1]|nr:hypothetical protein [Trichodesmium sp. St15_bin1_1]
SLPISIKSKALSSNGSMDKTGLLGLGFGQQAKVVKYTSLPDGLGPKNLISSIKRNYKSTGNPV